MENNNERTNQFSGVSGVSGVVSTFPDMSQTVTMIQEKGWECPVCGKGVKPSLSYCDHGNDVSVIVNPMSYGPSNEIFNTT